jgi:hypothetical protein
MTWEQTLDEYLILHVVYAHSTANLEQARWLKISGIHQCLTSLQETRRYGVFVGRIVHAGVVGRLRTKKGVLKCASNDMLVSSYGRSGLICSNCPWFMQECKVQWRIAWRVDSTRMVYAITLSRFNSYLFTRYLQILDADKVSVTRTLTRIAVEPAVRPGLTYLVPQLRFDRWEDIRCPHDGTSQ